MNQAKSICQQSRWRETKGTNMDTIKTEMIEATEDTLDTTMARIHAQGGILQALDASGTTYRLSVRYAATEPAQTLQAQPLLCLA
jgi:hypothetical protein